MKAAQVALAVGTGTLAYILADGLDRYLAVYNPNETDPAKLPKHKFTSDGAGTLANTLNVASPPGLVRIGAGIGMAALPAVASVFVEHPLLRSSLEGAAVGAGVRLLSMLWTNLAVPYLLGPKKDATSDDIKKSFFARLYPAEVAAHLNIATNTPPGPKEVTGGGSSSAAPGLSGAPGVGAPDVGPFALQGPSQYPSAAEVLRAGISGPSPYPSAVEALQAGMSGGHESNRLETGIGYYPSVIEVLNRQLTAVQTLAPAVAAAMPGIAPAQAEQVAAQALVAPENIVGAVQSVFPNMPEEHRREFGRRLHHHVHRVHREHIAPPESGAPLAPPLPPDPGAPPPPATSGESVTVLTEEIGRRFPHFRHEHRAQLAHHLLAEPHDMVGAIRRAMPNEPEHLVREHAKHLHPHVAKVVEKAIEESKPKPEHLLAGVGEDVGVGAVTEAIVGLGAFFRPYAPSVAAHAFAQPWNLPGAFRGIPNLSQQQRYGYAQQLYPYIQRYYQPQYQQYAQQYYGNGAGTSLAAIVEQLMPYLGAAMAAQIAAAAQAEPYNLVDALRRVLPNETDARLHEHARRLHPYVAGSQVGGYTTPPVLQTAPLPPQPAAGVSQPPVYEPGPPAPPGPGPQFGKKDNCGCIGDSNNPFLGSLGDGEEETLYVAGGKAA